MEIVLYNDLAKGTNGSAELITKVDFNDYWQREMLAETIRNNSDGAVKFLNTLLNQGIESIDTESRSYTICGKKLPLEFLSSGERIFLLAYVANYTKNKVYFYRCLE